MSGLNLAEMQALTLTANLTNVVCQDVIGYGPTRDHDIAEFVDKIHQIQHMIMAQAAARWMPAEFRLLGETVVAP